MIRSGEVGREVSVAMVRVRCGARHCWWTISCWIETGSCMRTINGSLVMEVPAVAFRKLCIELRNLCEAMLARTVIVRLLEDRQALVAERRKSFEKSRQGIAFREVPDFF